MREPAPLRCPQCGAPVEPVEDDPFLACAFCGTRIYLDASRAVRHFLLEPALDERTALSSLARSLRAAEVRGEISPVSGELVFFPMWQVVVSGRTCTVLAAGALYEGVERGQIPAGDLKVFAPARAKGVRGEAARVVEATVPLEAALARASARASSLSESRIPEGRGPGSPAPPSPTDVEARLVHVPLHVIAYSLHGRTYGAAVDACTGRAHPITAPRSNESRIDVAFAALLGGGLVLNLAALSLFGVAPLASIALLGAIAWGLYAAGVRLARWRES